MRLSVDFHPAPASFGNFDVHLFHLGVTRQKMIPEDDSKPLDLYSKVLLCKDVDRILNGVRRDDLGVVPGSVGSSEITRQQSGDVDFLDRVNQTVAKNLENANARLAISLTDQFRHCVK